MKKVIALVLALVMCLCLFAACGNSDKNYEATLKIGYAGNDDLATSKSMVAWAAAVKEATEGRIVIETYSSGQLGTGVEMIEAVDLGTLDMSLADYSLMETYLPEITLLGLPCIIADYDHMWELYDGEVGQELNARLEEACNIKILDTIYNGFRYIGSVRALNTLEDCKGLIIRSPESDIYVNTFTLYGMNPTPLPLGDVYSALQTGVVEGVDSPIANFTAMSFGEVAPFILKSRHLCSALPVVINQDVWDKIPEGDQEIIMSTLETAVADCNKAVLAEEDAVFAELESIGVTFTEFSDDERALLVEAFEAYWGEYAAKNDCQDLLDKVMATM